MQSPLLRPIAISPSHRIKEDLPGRERQKSAHSQSADIQWTVAIAAATADSNLQFSAKPSSPQPLTPPLLPLLHSRDESSAADIHTSEQGKPLSLTG